MSSQSRQVGKGKKTIHNLRRLHRRRGVGDHVPAGAEWGQTSGNPGSAGTWDTGGVYPQRSPSHKCHKEEESDKPVLVSILRMQVLFCPNLLFHSLTQALLLESPQAVYVWIKFPVLKAPIAAFSGREETIPMSLPSKLKGQMVQCCYPSLCDGGYC